MKTIHFWSGKKTCSQVFDRSMDGLRQTPVINRTEDMSNLLIFTHVFDMETSLFLWYLLWLCLCTPKFYAKYFYPKYSKLLFSVHTRRVEKVHILCRRSWLYTYVYTGPLSSCTRTPSKQVSIHFFNGLCCQSAGRPGTRGVWQWENQGNCEESWLMKPQNVLIGVGHGRTEAISRSCLGLLTNSSRGVPILRVIDEWFFGVRYWPWLIARVYKSRVDVRMQMQMGEINVRQSETSRVYLPWGKPQEHVRLAWNMTLWFVKCETFSKENHFLTGA